MAHPGPAAPRTSAQVALPCLQQGRLLDALYLQLRRMDSLTRQRAKPSRGLAWLERLDQQWHAIRTAKGFRPSFPSWLAPRVGPVEAHIATWHAPPTLEALKLLQQACRGLYTQLTAALVAERQRAKRMLHERIQTFVDREIQKPQSLPITILGSSRTFRVTQCDLHTGRITIQGDEPLLPSYPVTWETHCFPVAAVSDDQAWLSHLSHDLTGLSITQTIPDPHTDASLDRLATFWATYWCRAPHLDEPGWDALLQCLPDLPPPPPEAFAPITPACLRAHFRRLHKHSATGLDGVSRDDMLALPDPVLSTLCSLYSDVERTGLWPLQAVSSAITSLAKTQSSFLASQTRPIQVFSQIYRAWSSIRSRQALRWLSPFTPVGLSGIPGRGVEHITYHLQASIDLAQSLGDPFGGVVMDITKAFDALPRAPILQACRRLGIPLGILRAWSGAMTANRRFFLLNNTFGTPTLTSRGVPQGCGLSCLAMTVVNLTLIHHLAWTLPPVVPHIYADNWELTAPDPTHLRTGFLLVQQFAQVLDLAMDAEKTHWWATTAPFRSHLKQQGVRLIHDARDLGSHIAYTRRPAKQGIRARNVLPQTWAALRASLAPPQQKALALSRTLWPRALHSAESNPPNDQVLHGYRAKAAKALGFGLKGQNSWATFALVFPLTADPGFFLLQRAIYGLYRNYEDQRLQDLWHCWLPFRYVTSQGTFSALRDIVGRIGLPMNNHGELLLPDIGRWPFLLRPKAEIRLVISYFWLRKVGWSIHQRFEYPVDRVLCPWTFQQATQHLDPQSLALVRKIVVGTFYSGEHTSHFADTGLCRHCGAPDSDAHRLEACPATQSCRLTLPPHWIEWPPHLRRRLVPLRAPSLPPCMLF